jgi:hypothetical protein
MFCTNCGAKNEEGTKFCQNCGESTTGVSKVTTATATAPNLNIGAVVKCGNCGYVGAPENGRSTVGVILAWLCVFFTPFITLIYFAVTHKYKCPKCKSTFLGIKNKEGVFKEQKRSGVFIALTVLVVIAVVGILAGIVLASLNSAREQANQDAEQNTTLSN